MEVTPKMDNVDKTTEALVANEVTSTLDGVDKTTKVVLVANDNVAFSDPHDASPKGKYYVISREVAKMSAFIKGLLENAPDSEVTKIHLPDIDGKTLGLVIMYMDHHHLLKAKKIPKPLKGPIREHLSVWDKNYLDNYLLKNGNSAEHEDLLKVLEAANFLNIEDLLSLSAASIASIMQNIIKETNNSDNAVVKIREMFKIENDFTPEEEKEIKEHTKWADNSEEK